MDPYDMQKVANAYHTLFSGPVAEIVLEDLAGFCRAETTTADPDNVYRTYAMEGRREVWLRINKYREKLELFTKPNEDYEYE